jgi:hypothetical protein
VWCTTCVWGWGVAGPQGSKLIHKVPILKSRDALKTRGRLSAWRGQASRRPGWGPRAAQQVGGGRARRSRHRPSRSLLQYLIIS